MVVSIISFLSSILIASTSIARAKGNDTSNITQARQVQLAFSQVIGDNTSLPHPGDISKVYCLGKTASETCSFSSTLQTGSLAINTKLSKYLKTVKASATVTIDGQTYNSLVYKCGPGSDSTTCNAALYWPQSSNTPCKLGIEVVSGSGGRICGINADGAGTTYVEAGVTSSGNGSCTPPSGIQNTAPDSSLYCAPISCPSPGWATRYTDSPWHWECNSCGSLTPKLTGYSWTTPSAVSCCEGSVCQPA